MIRMKESGEADICHGYHVSADIYLPPMTLNVDADTVESELRNFLGAYAKVASIKVDETGREKAKGWKRLKNRWSCPRSWRGKDHAFQTGKRQVENPRH